MDNVLCMCFLLALLAGANCHEDAHQRIDALDRDLKTHIRKFEHYQEKVDIDKEEILNSQTKERLALKRELKNTMKQQVKEALEEILSGEDYRDIIRSKVDQEVGHLRNHNALLKSQIHGLTKKYQHLEILLGVVKDQQRKFRKALEKVNTTPPKKEVEVFTDASLVTLARHIAQEKFDGLVLPMMLNIPTTSIINCIYSISEDGVGGDNEKQRIAVAEKCLLLWKEMTADVKTKDRIKCMERALRDMGKVDIADTFVDRHSNNQELTQDAFA